MIPKRIILILPCCIGDVVLATAALKALRRAYPEAHITWAVGSWSKAAVEGHNLLNAVVDTGAEALPVRSPGELWRFVRLLRAGRYDLAVSLIRSPLMSLAVLLSGIPVRAGLDSNGRGFGYTVRAKVNPQTPRHEGQVYLDVARAMGLDTDGCWANVPVRPEDMDTVRARLAADGIEERLFVLNPAGGRNPGMRLDLKRWPPEHFAALGERLARRLEARLVLLGGPDDGAVIESVVERLPTGLPVVSYAGGLTFGQIAALAWLAQVYVGNDTGLTHLAAAAGAWTAMILGPSDPVRYAPFTPDALALWKPGAVQSGGVAAGVPAGWNWAEHGIGVDEAEAQIVAYLDSKRP